MGTDRSLAAADAGNGGRGLFCIRSKDKKWGLFREINNSYSCKIEMVGKPAVTAVLHNTLKRDYSYLFRQKENTDLHLYPLQT